MREWKKWAKAAGMRAVKTFFQAVVATIGTAALVESVDWKFVVSSAAMAAILSLCTSLAGLPELDKKNGDEEECGDE